MRKIRKRHDVVLFEPVLISKAMKRLDESLQQVANKDVTVTLLGESGTGKDIMARRCHELSHRRTGPFVPINCAAIPEALFESELFGRERGAFTGSNERAIGKIEAASGGTLFLDEIGELPMSLQPKLLRFLESHRFMRLGGTAKLAADVRLICATLKPLDEEVEAGRFRADLYYRIQGITFRVPPLRERPADVEPLLDYFVSHCTAQHDVVAPVFPKSVRAKLSAWRWPGNVRELRNLVEQLCLLRPGVRLQPIDLPAFMRSAVPDELLSLPLSLSLAEVTERYIDAVLASEQGNRARTARRLKVSARTLVRRRPLAMVPPP